MPKQKHAVTAKFAVGQRVTGFHNGDSGKPKVGTVAEIKLVFGEGGAVLRYGVAYWPDYGSEVRRVEVPENLLSIPEGDAVPPTQTFNVEVVTPEPVAA